MICGSGIPRGRLVEVIGDPATTKSAFGVVVAAAFQRAGGIAIYLDSEAKLEKTWAERLGVDFSALAYYKPKDIKDAIRILGNVAKTASAKVPTVVCWDSLAGTSGVDELDATVAEEGMKSEKAARAKYLSAGFRATQTELTRRGVTVLGINQLRTNFDFRTGRSWTDSPGGRAIKYHSGLRLSFRSRGRVFDRVRDLVVGIEVEVEAIKNTCSEPFRRAKLRFRFESGFARWSGLEELLVRHGRITSASGWLRYRDRKFRKEELESIASELPDILAPLSAVAEENPLPEKVKTTKEAAVEEPPKPEAVPVPEEPTPETTGGEA